MARSIRSHRDAGALACNLSGGLRRQPAATSSSAAGGVANSTATRWRTAGLWILQTALASLILLLLWQPALSIAALKPQQNIVAVVVDDSRSVSATDAGTPRIETTRSALLEVSLINDLLKRFQVRLYRPGCAPLTLRSRTPVRLSGHRLRHAHRSRSRPVGARSLHAAHRRHRAAQ